MDLFKKRNIVLMLFALAAILVLGAGQAWAGSYKNASERNKKECKEWCAQTGDCEFCSTKRGCGQGYTAIRSWTGKGKNWHACGKRETRREAGIRHKEECNKWCKENPACSNCSKLAGCGKGYRTIKRWTGRGENWHACEKREKTDRASQNNKAACNEWCAKNPNCRKCTTFTTCGLGVKTLKRFGGAGENWYACEK